MLTSCVVLAAVDVVTVYLPALGEERGLTSGAVALLLALRAAASMATRFFLGGLARFLGRTRLLLVSVVAAAAGLAVAPLPMPLWVLAAAIVLVGLGLGAGQPLTMAWVAESVSPGVRGRALALRLTGNRLGQVVVPTTVGVAAAALGAGGVLWATAASLAAVTLAARRLGGGPIG